MAVSPLDDSGWFAGTIAAGEPHAQRVSRKGALRDRRSRGRLAIAPGAIY
jgi:hypothetical protein